MDLTEPRQRRTHKNSRHTGAVPEKRIVEPKTRIVACGVFRPVLRHLDLTRRYPGVAISFLPARLHLEPARLKQRMIQRLRAIERLGERPVCLYGRCFPEIEEVCRRFGAPRIEGEHCYEMLLGSERYHQLMEEGAGTYFLECELLSNFENYCMDPLELQDEEMREIMFQHYNKLYYLRQPDDPDLQEKASRVARFLNLSLDVGDVDYSHLKNKLLQLI
jgi:hypothetical protein